MKEFLFMAPVMEIHRDPSHQGQQRAAGATGANSLASKCSSEKEQTIELNCMIILQTTLSFTKAICQDEF